MNKPMQKLWSLYIDLPSNKNKQKMGLQQGQSAGAQSMQPPPESGQSTKLEPPDKFGSRFWTPSWCRWNDDNPPPFTIWLNVLYAFAGGFTSANLYYSYPILNILANDFKTTQVGAATIPTVAQAGSAAGLVLIMPLADFFPRRQFTLILVFLAAAMWLGLCVTDDLTAFNVLTFLSAAFTGTNQVMLPLVAELSTPENRAFNLSIVAAGPTLGILLARILSGIVTDYTSWRNVYWLGLGMQGCVLILLWLFMPDYPATNPTSVGKIAKRYPKILWSIVTLYPKYPVLVQASLISFCTFMALTSYWTTLTFLLANSPYRYSSTIVGLFGLIGLPTMLLSPVYSRYIIQPLREPLYSVVVGKTISLLGTVIGTYTGTLSVAGPIIQAVMLDAGLMFVQISNRMSIHRVEPQGRNRVNTAFVAIMFLGQLAGTKAGNQVYENNGGWVASGSLSVGILLFGYVLVALKGPHEQGWIGWSGGWGVKPNNRGEGDDDRDGIIGQSVELRDLNEEGKSTGPPGRPNETLKIEDSQLMRRKSRA